MKQYIYEENKMTNINDWAYAKHQINYYRNKMDRLQNHPNFYDIRKKLTTKIQEIKEDYPDYAIKYKEWIKEETQKLTPEYYQLYRLFSNYFYESNFTDTILNPRDGFNIYTKYNSIVFCIIKMFSVDLSDFLNRKQIAVLREWLKSDWEIYSNGNFIAITIIKKIQEIKNNEVNK